ncbi:MAG: hypothetical protein IJ105_02620 [Bacilli bacterium]|nr:hypothetical protein [Bacilli bacterium]
MKKTAIMSLIPYLKGSYPIGVGTTAICFLMKNGNVLKVFLNTYNKNVLFNYYDNIIEHFERINTLKNDTYIVPEELLIKDGKCIAYIYKYEASKTLKSIRLKTRIDCLIDSYDKLLEDTKKISYKKFDIIDLHDRNILFGPFFKIIDLDQGNFKDNLTEEELFRYNMININETIIYSLLRKDKRKEIIEFYDKDLEKMYKEYAIKDFKKMKLFLKELEKHNINTVKDIKLNSNKLVLTTENYYRHY